MKTRRPTGLVVALDGPASSGKSSVGAAAALQLGYRFVDTGLLYRALTWLAIRRDVGEDDPAALVTLVPEVDLVPDEQGRLAHVSVDGDDVTSEVRSAGVDARVSGYSRIPELRAALLERQRQIARPGRIIVAGRDIGTVVLPDADLKIFLNASAEERARRRAGERGIDPDGAEGQEILAELRRRDEVDSTRTVAPLRAADDARVLVTDGNTFEETVGLVVATIRESEGAKAAAKADAASGSVGLPTKAAGSPLEGHLTPLIRTVAGIARLLSHAVTRIRVEGDLDAIPRSGPLILAANHVSNADPVVIGAFLTPRLGRRMHWLGKKEMFDWPLVGWLARNGGVVPVERSGADLEAYRSAARILEQGHVLMVFPEGTRSPDGTLQPAKDGVAMLALRTGAPIVPIGVADSDRVWPKGRKLPKPGGHIRMRVGPPFRLDDAAGGAGRAAKAAATRRLMGRIAALLPERQRGLYAADVDGAATRPTRQPAESRS